MTDNLHGRNDETDLPGIIFEEMLELKKVHGILVRYEISPGQVIKGAFLKDEDLPENLLNKYSLKEYFPMGKEDRKRWEAHKKGKTYRAKGERRRFGFKKRLGG